MLPVLSQPGHDDVAYTLLLAEDFPSWLYMVEHGATTMWETWDANRKPDYSHNHYAYGSVGGWLLRHAVAIWQDTGSVGFRRIVIRPPPEGASRTSVRRTRP